MLRFKGAELRPVLEEARAYRCRVLLVKDEGVYFMSEAGQTDGHGNRAVLAYACGCNPNNEDDEDSWWDVSRIVLGSSADFTNYYSVDESVLQRVANSGDDLILQKASNGFCLETAAPADW